MSNVKKYKIANFSKYVEKNLENRITYLLKNE